MELSKLELVRASRKTNGVKGKAKRDYYDFVVNGTPLSQLVELEEMDNISCLWIPATHWTEQMRQRLLLQIPSGLPDHRCSLYVCAECGDIGCGAVTVQIEMDETTVTWRDFGHQNNYERGFWSLDHFEPLGVLKFDRQEYEHLLSNLP